MAVSLRRESTTSGLEELDELFKGFADLTRIRILNLLVAGELCVCDIVTILELPQPTVSRHLAYLRNNGLAIVTRESKFAHYRLAAAANPVHASLIDCVEQRFGDIRSLRSERHRAAKRVKERELDPC